MVPPPVPHDSNLRTSRIESLSDAIFGIVMTILVIEIPVPEIAHPTGLDIPRALLRLWPRFLGYFLSFVVLGVYWVAQHEQFHFIKRADQALLWMTMLFLMLVASVPFSTTLIGRYLDQQAVVALYGTHLLAIGLVHHATWHHATRSQRLVDLEVDPEDVRSHLRRSLVPPVIYLAAIGLSFLSTVLSVVAYALVPVVYAMLPSIYTRRGGSQPRGS
jgi:uncharacterized membrane protein